MYMSDGHFCSSDMIVLLSDEALVICGEEASILHDNISSCTYRQSNLPTVLLRCGEERKWRRILECIHSHYTEGASPDS